MTSKIKNVIIIGVVLAALFGCNERKGSASYYEQEGIKYANAHKNELAIGNFKQSLQYDSANVNVYFHIARTYGRMEMPDSTLAYYNTVIRMDSKYPYLYFFKGLFYAGVLHQLDSAISTFKTAIKINPDEIESYGCLASMYEDNHQLDSALKYINIAISKDSSFSSEFLAKGGLFMKRASIYRELKQDQQAISDFKTAADMGFENGSRRLKELYNIDYPVSKNK